MFNALLLKSQVEQLKIERKVKVEYISKVRLLKWKFFHLKKLFNNESRRFLILVQVCW
jgi:hypothetical protein